MKALRRKIDNEGLGYFLMDYGSPDLISDDADAKALQFKALWEKIEDELSQLNALASEEDEDDDDDDDWDDEEEEEEGDDEDSL
jgi:hypothetical protein